MLIGCLPYGENRMGYSDDYIFNLLLYAVRVDDGVCGLALKKAGSA